MSTEAAMAEVPSKPVPSVTVQPKLNTDAPPMKAVAWWGKHDVRVVEKPRPMVTDPEDVVVRVTTAGICGSDLHLYGGAVAGIKKGDIIGHEFMGVVKEVGPHIVDIQVGDRVVVSAGIGCGRCDHCFSKMYNACDVTLPSTAQEQQGHYMGAVFGYGALTGGYDGGQAEYVRVPFANVNCLKFSPQLTDERVVFLSDILPTAWHANEMGEVGPGKNVAIWGAGPVGMLAAMCAFHRGAARVVLIDRENYRLEKAAAAIKGLETIDASKAKVDATLRTMFPKFHGPDVCIDAVGAHHTTSIVHKLEQTLGLETDPADTLNEVIRCARKGGCISIIGVYTGYTNHFNIGAFMEKGLTMRMGQTPVQRYWPVLLPKVESGELDPSFVITHTLPLEQASHAYKMFNERAQGCVKVLLKPSMKATALEPAAEPAAM